MVGRLRPSNSDWPAGRTSRASWSPLAPRQRVGLGEHTSQLGQFGLPPDWTPERGLEAGQAEALRKMLLAVIGDVRLVVVRLAEQLQKMRAAKSVTAAATAEPLPWVMMRAPPSIAFCA